MDFKIVIIIVIVLLLILFLIYNYLVKLSNRCNNAWSNIDNQLKRRIDLIPNLVEVTKGYAKHESETLLKVVNERNKKIDMSYLAKEEDKISSSVKALVAVAENYPDLKANKLFQNLQVELVGTEDKIAFARQFYNDCVQKYNTAIMVFPTNIFAKLLKYNKKEYFKIEEKDKELGKISL